MSELKVYHCNEWHNEYTEFYLKSEADKVIAELKSDYKEACGRLQTANLIKDEQLAATRHSKYKRCLAMASSCSDKASAEYASSYVSCDEYYYHHAEFWVKWENRWRELAEKFKEAK